jgi:glycosyltransferase involved in cell wall biosynthesis
MQFRFFQKMKVLHISISDGGGGAARAAYRIHGCIKKSGVSSEMLVLNKVTDDLSVRVYKPTNFERIVNKFQKRIDSKVRSGFKTRNQVLHSFGMIGHKNIVHEINNSDADIVNLHWVCGMISVKQISKIKKPIVWTLHDMWPFCGGEHYNLNEEDGRYRDGYSISNRSKYESGEDLNARCWGLKMKYWENLNFVIIGDSQWLMECAKESQLFKKLSCSAIGYPLDMQAVWQPVDKAFARQQLGISPDVKVIVMGAIGGISDVRKGGDLLISALKSSRFKDIKDVELLIYGQSEPQENLDIPFKAHWVGPIADDRKLALVNSAADVAVIPSRQEAFGQTVLEAQACGIPVVAFNIGGIPDIVEHNMSGYLARPFDTDDLARGIVKILADDEKRGSMSKRARDTSLRKFSFDKVAIEYKEIYLETLKSQI